MECGAHSKKSTKKTKTEQTKIYDDGQFEGFKPDTEEYVEMNEE